MLTKKAKKVRRKKPLLTQKQKETRLKFARAEKEKGFNDHIFYDESPFQGWVAPRGQWVDASAEPRPHVTHPVK